MYYVSSLNSSGAKYKTLEEAIRELETLIQKFESANIYTDIEISVSAS